MRTKRTNGSTTYEYIYNGSQLTQMTMNENGTVRTLYFIYDASGPIAFNMASGGSNTTYYYAKNAQGDIIAIVNKAGTAVVTYSYDAWGNLLSIDGEYKNGLGIRNPLRYRGYVYDNETGLYYLQSRYYDPTIGRFLNADAFTSTGQGLLGNNMFAYCNNNPVNRIDPSGSASFEDLDYATDPEDSPTDDVTTGGGALGVVVSSAIATIATPPLADQLARKLAKSFANAKSHEYRTTRETHHIVPKAAKSTVFATFIVNYVIPYGVENPLNKISINTGLHRRLHSYLYCSIVNITILTAYFSASTEEQQQQNVFTAIAYLRAIVNILNENSPF